jgi:outer membrane receptor protein involved in Fe transport
VTVNGEALASTRNEERYSQLDIVGSNQMSMIEVIKAITPDMDANSIGGSVNIITESAFDYPDRNLKATIGSGYSNLGGKFNWQGKFNYSDKLANGKLGYSITANYDRKSRGVDNFELEYDNETDINGNEIPYALADFALFDYQVTKERLGVGGGLEYRFNKNHRIYTNLMYNKFKDVNERSRLRVRVAKGIFLNPEGTLTTNSRAVREDNGRTENLIQNHFTLGGEHHFGSITLDYKGSISYGEENHPDLN